MLADVATGFTIGLAATACMTLWELVFYRRYGLEGALDWHINQCALSRINGRAPNDNLLLGLAVHGGVGGAVGAIFVVVARTSSLAGAPVRTAALALGIVLWVLLLPLRRQFTNLGPFEGPLGFLPAGASLVGHVIFGLVLGQVVTWVR